MPRYVSSHRDAFLPNITRVNISKECNITWRDIEHVHNLQSDLRKGGRITLTSIPMNHDGRVWSGLTLQISDMSVSTMAILQVR